MSHKDSLILLRQQHSHVAVPITSADQPPQQQQQQQQQAIPLWLRVRYWVSEAHACRARGDADQSAEKVRMVNSRGKDEYKGKGKGKGKAKGLKGEIHVVRIERDCVYNWEKSQNLTGWERSSKVLLRADSLTFCGQDSQLREDGFTEFSLPQQNGQMQEKILNKSQQQSLWQSEGQPQVDETRIYLIDRTGKVYLLEASNSHVEGLMTMARRANVCVWPSLD